jgi:hypothetical protein
LCTFFSALLIALASQFLFGYETATHMEYCYPHLYQPPLPQSSLTAAEAANAQLEAQLHSSVEALAVKAGELDQLRAEAEVPILFLHTLSTWFYLNLSFESSPASSKFPDFQISRNIKVSSNRLPWKKPKSAKSVPLNRSMYTI